MIFLQQKSEMIFFFEKKELFPVVEKKFNIEYLHLLEILTLFSASHLRDFLVYIVNNNFGDLFFGRDGEKVSGFFANIEVKSLILWNR